MNGAHPCLRARDTALVASKARVFCRWARVSTLLGSPRLLLEAEPRGAARPHPAAASELSLRPSRRPGLLARGVGHLAGHTAPAPRGLARRARALRAPRAPSPSLSPRAAKLAVF